MGADRDGRLPARARGLAAGSLTDIPLLRIPLEPGTGLSRPSSIMVDKVTTVPRAKLGERIGAVSDTTLLALSRALIVFSGIA